MAKRTSCIVLYYRYDPRIMGHVQRFIDCFDKLEHAQQFTEIRANDFAQKLKRSVEPIFGPNDKMPDPQQLLAIDSYYVILEKHH